MTQYTHHTLSSDGKQSLSFFSFLPISHSLLCRRLFQCNKRLYSFFHLLLFVSLSLLQSLASLAAPKVIGNRRSNSQRNLQKTFFGMLKHDIFVETIERDIMEESNGLFRWRRMNLSPIRLNITFL